MPETTYREAVRDALARALRRVRQQPREGLGVDGRSQPQLDESLDRLGGRLREDVDRCLDTRLAQMDRLRDPGNPQTRCPRLQHRPRRGGISVPVCVALDHTHDLGAASDG